MRKLITAATAICFLIACNNEKKEEASGGMSDKAKKNIAASHIVSDAFMSGDPSKIDSAVAPDFVDHTDRGDMGRDSLKAAIVMMKKQMPDMKMKLTNELANDDYVYSDMEFTGTSDGSMGMPKGPYDMHVIEAVKFNQDSKAVEHWEYMRNDDMMKMMQSMMPPPATKEPTKKPKK
jgi:predicted SnoaL-like aldol condensation-catalyzing enzyme